MQIPSGMTTTDPVEAEATGQPFLTPTFRGVGFKIPTDADDWPLPLVGASLSVTAEGEFHPNYAALSQALTVLVGDVAGLAPKRRHMVALSQTIAAAAGFPAVLPVDVVFGALPRRLAVLDVWPAPAEATLNQLGQDYADRWRFTTDGRRKLTLRKIHVLLSHPPYDSPLAVAQNDNKRPLSDTALVVMDLFEHIARKAHPARPLTPEQKAERQKAEKSSADAVADYRKRHNLPETRRATAIQLARSNAKPER